MADLQKLDKVTAMDLINEALNNPGKRLEAYNAFYTFSLRNQMLAEWQMVMRGIEISPIKTFKQWKEYGRSVKKGEQAIALLMPMFVNVPVNFDEQCKKVRNTIRDIKKDLKMDTDEPEEVETEQRQIFVMRNYWFALSQTKAYKNTKDKTIKKLEKPSKTWTARRAMKNLKIKLIDFQYTNGNAQGYATKKGIAINPLAQFPTKTAIHEMAHTILGHLKIPSYMFDVKSIREAEAEMTAYLVTSSLGLKGQEYQRQYIRSWLAGNKFPEASALRVINAANKILTAGQPSKKKNTKKSTKTTTAAKAAEKRAA